MIKPTWRRLLPFGSLLAGFLLVVLLFHSLAVNAQVPPLQPGEVEVDDETGEIRYALANGQQMQATGWLTDDIGAPLMIPETSVELARSQEMTRGYDINVMNGTLTETLVHGSNLSLFEQYIDGENRGWDVTFMSHITQSVVIRVALDISSTIQFYGGTLQCQWLEGLVQCTGVTGPHDPVHVFQNKWRPGSPTCSSMVIQTWPTSPGNTNAYDTHTVKRCGNVYAPLIVRN